MAHDQTYKNQRQKRVHVPGTTGHHPVIGRESGRFENTGYRRRPINDINPVAKPWNNVATDSQISQ